MKAGISCREHKVIIFFFLPEGYLCMSRTLHVVEVKGASRGGGGEEVCKNNLPPYFSAVHESIV